MGRLNQLLEPLSVDQARGSDEAGGPLRIFALHELEGLDPDEAALLARMVQDLPGARMALFILGYRRRRLPEVLEESFRRGLRSWSIPIPSEENLEAFEACCSASPGADRRRYRIPGTRRATAGSAPERTFGGGAKSIDPTSPPGARSMALFACRGADGACP
jgi:hypothetical protein